MPSGRFQADASGLVFFHAAAFYRNTAYTPFCFTLGFYNNQSSSFTLRGRQEGGLPVRRCLVEEAGCDTAALRKYVCVAYTMMACL